MQKSQPNIMQSSGNPSEEGEEDLWETPQKQQKTNKQTKQKKQKQKTTGQVQLHILLTRKET